MSKTPSQQLATEIKTLGNEVMAIYKEHDYNPTGDARKAVTEKRTQMEALNTKYLEAQEREQGKAAVQEHLKSLENPGRRSVAYATEPGGRSIKTIADMVMEDEGFKSWFVAKAAHGGPTGQFRSPSVEGIGLKTLVTGANDASAGAFVRTDYDTDVPLPWRELNLRDLVTIGTTESDTIGYVQETARINNAAVTPEATATAGASGTSPESGLVFQEKAAIVQDITTWIPATRRALSDAGQMRVLIDTELRAMVAEKFEDYLMQTVLGTPGITMQPFVTDKLRTARKAITKTRVTGLAKPNGFLLHPQDWEDIELMTDGEQRFYLGGPGEEARPYLWSNPVTQNVAMTQGMGLTGDFKTVKVYDREQTQVFSTDSHADFFIRSISVMLCVMRAAVAVKRPSALTEFALV